jgi:hypothetical protein
VPVIAGFDGVAVMRQPIQLWFNQLISGVRSNAGFRRSLLPPDAADILPYI